jgi:RHS repeat-associated protein
VLYIHTDHLGTPRELTDSGGNLQWAATYKAWGNVLRVEMPQVGTEAQAVDQVQALRFQGQYFDVETGLHYNRFRYYDPDIGRFVSQDPIGLTGGNNLYQYAPNPSGWVDPFGLAGAELNAPGYTVYGLYKPGADVPYYVGHTVQDPLVRAGQHGLTGRLGESDILKPLAKDLTYTQAKGNEQFYRELYGTKTGFPGNVIEPIDKSRTDPRGQSHIAEYEKVKAAHARSCC